MKGFFSKTFAELTTAAPLDIRGLGDKPLTVCQLTGLWAVVNHRYENLLPTTTHTDKKPFELCKAIESPGYETLAYPPLTQTAFLLLSELCRYLPGLIKPFSLSAVVPPVHFDIIASFLTIFHFIIAKGEDVTDPSTITEILESLNLHSRPMHTAIKRFDLALDLAVERGNVRLIKDGRVYHRTD